MIDDLISKQEMIDAIDILKRNYPSSCFEDLCKAVDIAIKALSAQPEPSAIRCKDCKYFRQHSIEDIKRCGFKHDGMCVFWNSHSTNFEWYCSNGERSEDG